MDKLQPLTSQISDIESDPLESSSGVIISRIENIANTFTGSAKIEEGTSFISTPSFLQERARYLQKVHPLLFVRCDGDAYLFQLQEKFTMFDIRLTQDFQYEDADVESIFVTNYTDRWPKEIKDFMDFGGISIHPLKKEQRIPIHETFILENIPNDWTSADVEGFVAKEFEAKEIHVLDLHDFERCCVFFSENVDKIKSFKKEKMDISVGNCYSFRKIENVSSSMSIRLHTRFVGLFGVSMTESLKSVMESSLKLPVNSIPEINQAQLKIPYFEEEVGEAELLQIFKECSIFSNPYSCKIYHDSDNQFKAYISFRDVNARLLTLYNIYVDGGVQIKDSKRRVLAVPGDFMPPQKRLIYLIGNERMLIKPEIGSSNYEGQSYESPGTLFHLPQGSAGPHYQTPRPPGSHQAPRPSGSHQAPRPSGSHHAPRPSGSRHLPPRPSGIHHHVPRPNSSPSGSQYQAGRPSHPSGSHQAPRPSGSHQAPRPSSNPSRTSHHAPPQEYPGTSQRLPPDRTRPTGTAGPTG